MDLGDVNNIPQLDDENCWEYFDEITIYTFEEYVRYYVNLPYDKDKKKFLWTPYTIPVASSGKIKDWEKETTGPCYADVDGSN